MVNLLLNAGNSVSSKGIPKKTQNYSELTRRILTSQHPRGSPLAASNPADMMVKSGANSEAVKLEIQDIID